ncbi:MAG: hypothetical protein K6U80_13165 [Firmicutes bacterium]|nr:hypothetical protein [Bacillota bacterium]
MRVRSVFLSCLALLVMGTMILSSVEAGLNDQINDLIKKGIENLALEAKDMIPDLGLHCSPVKNLIKVTLNITPNSLKKQAASIKLTSFTSAEAMASFELLAHYDLIVNDKSLRANDIRMIGEGKALISFANFKIKIEDIPSLVLKLANQASQCPDIGKIIRDPVAVSPGAAYQVSTTIKSNNPGHVAYFVFANNKAAQSPDPTLQVKIGTAKLSYKAPIVTKPDVTPDNYFGNVMAVELISKTGNPFDFNSYDLLFSTGITMITVK